MLQGLCYGLNYVPISHPSNLHVEFLAPSTLKCDPLWEQSFHRGERVKIRSSGWVLIQFDWCPHRKGKFEHRHILRKDTWRDTGGNGHVQAKERGVGKTLPSGLSLGTSPADTLILDFQPPEL